MPNEKLIYPELSYELSGILFEVHNELGRFRNEQQYGDAIEQKFKEHNIHYERELILPPSFEGEAKGRNKLDFLIEEKIILEIKAKRIITRMEYYQVKRYLISYGKKLAILVNFQDTYLKPRRILNSLAEE